MFPVVGNINSLDAQGGMQGNHGGMQGNHGGMQGNHGGMIRDPSFVEGDVNSGKCGKPVCPQ